ncbi:MAG: hypothetical protein LRZ84_26565 [Desertifilum sp.]|nr:hypothetical protein [Desertifilum sp.]
MMPNPNLQAQETDKQKNKAYQREAVENCFTNFVEPQFVTQVQLRESLVTAQAMHSPSTSLLLAVVIWFAVLCLHLSQLRKQS